MKIEQFINEYKINKVMLANHLGIHPCTLSQKLNKRGYDKLTPEQIEKTKQYLKDIALKINKLCQ